MHPFSVDISDKRDIQGRSLSPSVPLGLLEALLLIQKYFKVHKVYLMMNPMIEILFKRKSIGKPYFYPNWCTENLLNPWIHD